MICYFLAFQQQNSLPRPYRQLERARAQTLSHLCVGADGVAVDSEWDVGRLSVGLRVDIDLRHGSTTGGVDVRGCPY